jgi:hypothetical protein
MENMNTLLVFLVGVFIRLAIPITITLMAIYFLRRLDVRWQNEAGAGLRVEKPECWKAIHCPPAARAQCPGFQSPEPCWQTKRKLSGYLADDCLTCDVFQGAPLPTHY